MIAVFAVILVHTSALSGSQLAGDVPTLRLIVDQIARFAVPCFFVLSGFFWAAKVQEMKSAKEPSVRMAKRLALLFFGWSAVYLLPTDIQSTITLGILGPIKTIYWNISRLAADPLTALLQGAKIHLWFLAALLCCVSISAVMVSVNMTRSLLALAVVLFGIGLLGKAYADTPIGFHTGFNFRNGPFFGLIFFVTGFFLQRMQRVPGFSWGLSLAAAGTCLHLIEIFVLHERWGTSMLQDYVVGTYASGLGFALIGLSGAAFLRNRLCAQIGPFVLGIYAVHFVFIDLLRPVRMRFAGHLMWDCAYPILVFILSAATARILGRYPISRTMVA